jgi:manganese/zinc/iron transport system permease protein
MVDDDAWLIGGSALVCLLVCSLLFKEFKLLCFDEAFAGSRGFPTLGIDIVLMALVVTITIVGLQAVGLVLMIALLVIPAAAARFWTEQLFPLAILSASLGALGCLVGASLSALAPRLPSGAMIVLTSSFFFLLSLLCGSRRGLTVRLARRWRLNRRIDRQHLLRAMYEFLESQTDAGRDVHPVVPCTHLLGERSWGGRRLARCIARCRREGLVFRPDDQTVELTGRGFYEAERLTRQHRLWELYLITHADIAASRVDRDADAIEHVLEPAMVQKLSRLLHAGSSDLGMPQSPHAAPPLTAGGPHDGQ